MSDSLSNSVSMSESLSNSISMSESLINSTHLTVRTRCRVYMSEIVGN
ncbi:hypothetical protein [Lactobacillus taiwanensis]|nr:hypothetical protein [Lactobacillus taiwanensis]